MRLTMRIVLSGADKELKVLAIRYYMTLVKGFVFDINLPAASQAAYDRVKESQSKVDELRDQNPLIALYLDANATVHMNITQYSFADRAGRWVQPGMEQQGGFPFQVTQDGLRSDMGFAATGKSYNCSVSLHPTDALTMEGTMRCIGSKGSLPPISLSATLF